MTLEDGIVGLLGPNGAGKSTVMQMIATMTVPTSGSIEWRGTDIVDDPSAIRADLGYLPQDFGVYPNLDVDEFLDYVGALHGLDTETTADRADWLLRQLNLEDARDRQLGTFSGGMRQRVGIACALLSDPRLLVVDEPMTGLDPEERSRFRNYLAEFAQDRLVVFSTHIVSDVQAVASSIAILDDGQLVEHDDPGTLLASVADRCWRLTVSSDRLADGLDDYIVSSVTRRGDDVEVDIVASGRPDPEATAREPTLEDAYLWLTGGDHDAGASDRVAEAAPGEE